MHTAFAGQNMILPVYQLFASFWQEKAENEVKTCKTCLFTSNLAPCEKIYKACNESTCTSKNMIIISPLQSNVILRVQTDSYNQFFLVSQHIISLMQHVTLK